ncbi:MAG: CocE/NonD family hydrolase [Clostridiales Family XIII bacterium]|jgi:putative CocE/NonD family hydrolase|nr:CocE/NonD family hydrolase [Clostridiales Family XIII bacterium]
MGNASEPKYKTIKETFMVPSRDGVGLAVDVYRPDAEGQFPALLAQSPYGKDAQAFESPPQPFGKSIFEASVESGDPYFYAKRGYAYAIADFRGLGDSEGYHDGMMNAHERGEDGYDICEWLAAQPWCDGGVGGAGICYFANAQLQLAAAAPPHLKCIAPWEIYGDDLYKHGQYEGGVLNIFLYGLYTGTYPARCGYAVTDRVRSAMQLDYADKPEAFEKLVQGAMADPDLRQYPYLFHLLKYPTKNPVLFDFMLNPLDGPYYRERSVIERIKNIKVPTYVGGPFFSFFSEPQINVWNRLPDVPKKLRFYTDMGTRPWKGDHDELLRWYDYWLKGIDTGIMDEEPVRYHVTGLEKWRTAKEFPIENMEYTPFYLNSLQSLGTGPDFFNDEPDSFVQAPLFVTEDRAYVRYVSPPLSENLQCTGAPRVKFWASIDQKDTTWRVNVRVFGSGDIYPLAQGWLKASLRKRDYDRDVPWEIEHDYTKFDNPEPGGIYEYEIQMRPMSHMFKAGDRIQLEISNIDIPIEFETYDIMWHVCPATTTLHKIYRDGDHPSVLLLPVIPAE